MLDDPLGKVSKFKNLNIKMCQQIRHIYKCILSDLAIEDELTVIAILSAVVR